MTVEEQSTVADWLANAIGADITASLIEGQSLEHLPSTSSSRRRGQPRALSSATPCNRFGPKGS
ncbi:hypothetical protein [Promicromonospora xylanilytica]